MTVELHTLTGAYAAHALSLEEVVEFEDHLAGCPSCQQESRELTATVARMGEAEYDVPPADLKARIMSEVSRTRQLPPPGGVRAPVIELAARRRNRLLLTVAASVAALAIVGGGITGVVAYQANQRNHQLVAADRAVAAVLSAPDARTVTANGPAGSHGTAVVSDLNHSAVFSAAAMPQAAGGHVWQLWVIDASGARSVGVLDEKSNGSVTPVVAKDVPATGASFGVTQEPAGGSKQPTTKPVLLMPLHT
jgi:anti-sigma-K factor RskA